MFERSIAAGLGFASIGIGLTELTLPRQLERTMGIGDGQNTSVLRVLGIRECLHGVDLLSHRDPTPGVWARVAGDALDGALLGVAATRTRRPGGFAAITAMVLGIVALDVLLAWRLGRQKLES